MIYYFPDLNLSSGLLHEKSGQGIMSHHKDCLLETTSLCIIPTGFFLKEN
uniref:Uncharacterized protein n=1 Tax=Octopus bimaculoides TaxID=37653 RepID=A0A0L8I9S9_OCTBM